MLRSMKFQVGNCVTDICVFSTTFVLSGLCRYLKLYDHDVEVCREESVNISIHATFADGFRGIIESWKEFLVHQTDVL